MSNQAPAPADDVRRGTAYGFLAYAVWGAFPLYFHALKPAGAFEILAHRIVWTLVLCAAVLLVRRDLGWVRGLVRNPRLAGGVALAAVLIAVNWVVYVAAVISGHTTDAALGYFLNPLVTVALGVVVLREQLRTLQWVAVGIGAVAAVYLTVAGGRFPLVALTLAFSFGMYGLVKNRVGVSLQAMQGLAAETVVLAPVAVVVLVVLGVQGSTTFTVDAPWHPLLLVLSGVATAVPLLLFAAAARRIPLTLVGLLQFLTPILQLLAAVLVLHEPMPAERWIGFSIVWVALVVLVVDMLRARPRRRRPPAGGVDGIPGPVPS